MSEKNIIYSITSRKKLLEVLTLLIYLMGLSTLKFLVCSSLYLSKKKRLPSEKIAYDRN
ncbi:hypothetical protein BCR32DRAFT_278299 [Anaeromyces robustus]|uniref:Uncharacterized protein n=1 Tax=Anaeromyces robustus TaxID=1754192 RepID=A0A1Y1XBQ1_9FUNG|nr:hypothetical protein BCR32DRAFT_278299 [Anaeromyces robustus]|eukprot:ORX83143.1 hypothetical protein BCR32DRAFT_278299 [Anaeromyces robustus]